MLLAAAAFIAGISPSGTYFCGSTFTFPILVGEQVSTTEAGYVWSTKQGDFAFRETNYPVPAGAKPIKDQFGIKVYAVSEGIRVVGYILSVNDQPTKTIVMGSKFTGEPSDLDVLSRFNFHPNRPPECRE